MKKFIQRYIVLLGIVFIGALAGLGFVACTSDDDVLNRLDEKVATDSNPRLRTEAEAIEIAIGNLGMIDRAVPRSRAASDIVADVSVIGSKVKSRNGATNDTLLYAVNFKNNEGFALVPASRKADPLLAICEKGNYSPGCEKLNPGFGIYMGLAEKKLTDLEIVSDEPTLNTGDNDSEFVPEFKPYDGDNTRPLETKETSDTIWHFLVQPRVKVQWGQKGIYGALAPNKTAGCAPVAMAQAMSYFNHPRYMKFTFNEREIKELHIDWEQIKRHQKRTSFSYQCQCDAKNHTHISHILRQIGKDAKSEYKDGGRTPTNNNDTKSLLKKHGFSISGFHKYNAGDGIKIGDGIILIYGDDTNAQGKYSAHIWVLDGIKNFTTRHTVYCKQTNSIQWTVMSQNTSTFHFNHFNWGWDGDYDGWFNDMVFNREVPVDMSYWDQNIGTPGYDFKHHVQYLLVNH